MSLPVSFCLLARPSMVMLPAIVARFADQMAFLEKSGDGMHSAAHIQRYLWAFHERGTAGFGSGIAAFPSVHVSLVTLNALFLFEFSRKAGLVACAYVALVVASSVYLAWHYAIDGYAAIILTIAIYGVIRWLLSVAAVGGDAMPSWPAQAADHFAA